MVLVEQRAVLGSQGHKFTAATIHVAWRRETELNTGDPRGERGAGAGECPRPRLCPCQLSQKGQGRDGDGQNAASGAPGARGDRSHAVDVSVVYTHLHIYIHTCKGRAGLSLNAAHRALA